VPIIGNGDVLTWYELEQRGIYLGGRGGPGGEGSSTNNGADPKNERDNDDGSGLIHAAMAGRGALVKPWLWTEARERRELSLTAEERVGVYRRLVSHMREHFGDDDKGRQKSWYFLPWHFNFFHRYRAFPRERYEARSLESPLLSMRVSLWDEGREDEGAEGVPPLERLLRTPHEGAHGELAAVLWDSKSDSEAVTALERLSREKVRDWERELYEKEAATGGGGGGRGRGGDARDGGGDEAEVEG
jgi:tRNA-dihydrouridine synthase 3